MHGPEHLLKPSGKHQNIASGDRCPTIPNNLDRSSCPKKSATVTEKNSNLANQEGQITHLLEQMDVDLNTYPDARAPIPNPAAPRAPRPASRLCHFRRSRRHQAAHQAEGLRRLLRGTWTLNHGTNRIQHHIPSTCGFSSFFFLKKKMPTFDLGVEGPEVAFQRRQSMGVSRSGVRSCLRVLGSMERRGCCGFRGSKGLENSGSGRWLKVPKVSRTVPGSWVRCLVLLLFGEGLQVEMDSGIERLPNNLAWRDPGFEREPPFCRGTFLTLSRFVGSALLTRVTSART